MIEGVPKFNALAIGKIEIDFLKNPIHIEVTAGFVNTKTSDTHGWTKATGTPWSEQTREKIKELVKFMEQDLAKLHFTDGAKRVDGAPNKDGLDLGGIGEHVGTVDAPSI